MNTFSVEDRTRMYQPFQSVYLRRGPCDESFDCQLPAEIRTELLEIPSEQVYRLRDQPLPRIWPQRIPETEEEIQQAIAWLKAQGFLQGSTTSAPPPPVPRMSAPPPPPQVLIRPAPVSPSAKPAQSDRSGTGIWLLLGVVLGFPILLALLAQAVTQHQFRSVEVRPALPPVVEVRRALPADTGSPSGIDTQRMVTIPDGGPVWTTFKGYLSDVSQLPVHGGQRGDMWAIGNNYWILTTVPGSSRVGWVDPPGDGVEVRRALPFEGAAVRRAKLVVPRAELLRLPGN